MSDDLEHRIAVPRFASDSMDALVKLLEPHHVHFTAKRQVPDVGLRVYFAAKLRGTRARFFCCSSCCSEPIAFCGDMKHSFLSAYANALAVLQCLVVPLFILPSCHSSVARVSFLLTLLPFACAQARRC